ncbi:hypothetical protein [Tunturiibacter gelidiferens]|uniref:hypothetical protein n=1 Tax=Tunturiibacter gelidiferens TaxID=3069689 RepID=UPI003D9AE65E
MPFGSIEGPPGFHGDTHRTDGYHRHHPMRRPTLRLRPQFTKSIEYGLFHLHEYRLFSSTQRLCRSQQAVHYDRLFCLMEGRELQKTIPYGVEGCLIFGLFEESRVKSLDSLGARFHYSDSGAAVPLQIQGNRLLVEASIGKALQDVFSLI